MRPHMISPLRSAFLALTVTLAGSTGAAEIVKAGAGSYSTQLPKGAKTAPATIFRTAQVAGPMPTNDWWSSLAWIPLSDTMYPHPLAVRAVGGGLRVYYPGGNITANNAAIFGFMPGGADDFTIGHSEVPEFAEARVDGFSDWFVDALFAQEKKTLRTSFGHGSPFVYCLVEGGNPTITFGKEAPKVWAKGDALGVSIGKRHYGIFAPGGTVWSDFTATKWTADTKGKGYFSIAGLPDDSPATLAAFAKVAHHHVTDSRVTWSYDEKNAAAQTTFTVAAKAYEGSTTGTLFALYPHQWKNTSAPLLPLTYESVRGPMKVCEGTSFTTSVPFPGVLPSLPVTAGTDRKKLRELVQDELKEKGKLVGDTYWLGKQLGKWATLLSIAEQLGDQAAVDELSRRLRGGLENFFTATDEKGAVKSRDEGLFYYDGNWSTLIGYPASYGSDDQLNDHHFHYGYFIRAAAEIARRDPAWAKQWGEMVQLLVRDIASTERADKLFPFLRCFDPYAGHTWASGHAKFGDGNNNESSSEAINAWAGLTLWGEATGDKAARDLGAWLFATEITAINDYWFDVSDQLHHPGFTPSVVTMVWGGKGANGTWFSGNPELVHGINWLPFTGASLYLGGYPEYAAKNYAALVEENKGTNWDQWADLMWMYRALTDPKDARTQFESRPADFKPEGGNSLANAFLWITTLEALGQVDRSVTADTPLFAVFKKGPRRTHVAYNAGDKARQIRFSDGVTLSSAPHAWAVQP